MLSSEPLCRQCVREGQTVVATEVDHHDNDPSNNDMLNLVPLCHSHHSRKTNADMGRQVRAGFDEHGMPIDPDHPWNSESASEKSPGTGQHEPTASLHLIAK